MNQLIVNGKEMILSDQTRIGITYQANNIGELQNRQGTFTNTFKLPIVRENIEALKLVNQMTSTTVLPYRKLSATYIENGIEIIGNGTATIVSIDSNFINMNIISGNVDLLEAIGDLTVGDLYLNDQVFPWTIDVAVLLRSGTAYLVYPLVDFYINEDNIFDGDTIVDIRNMLPCCNVKEMFNRLSDYIGFNFNGDYLTSSEHLKMILTPSDLSVKEENLLLLKTGSTDTLGTWSKTITTIHNATTNVDFYTDPSYNISDGDFLGNSVNVLNEVNGTLSFVSDIAVIYASNVVNVLGQTFNYEITMVYQIVDDLDVVVSEYTEAPQYVTSFPTTLNYVANINTGDILLTPARTYRTRIRLICDAVLGDTNITVKASTSSSKFTFTPSGKITHLTDTNFSDLYRMKVKDVLKDILNLRGVVIQTNGYTRNVQFNYFDDIIKNKSIAEDWSEKVQKGSLAMSFQFGNYAQKNWMRFKDRDDVTDQLGDYYFTIDNENFEAEKTVVQLNHPATEQAGKYLGYNIPKVQAFDNNYVWNKPDWRLLQLEVQNTSFNVAYTDGTTTINKNTYIPFAKFIGFEKTIPEFYEALSGILDKTKAIKLPIKLSAKEISELNFIIPKYLHVPEIGIDGYFYLNKIENYKGDITLCEFVRL
jgi:hypothetical protein